MNKTYSLLKVFISAFLFVCSLHVYVSEVSAEAHGEKKGGDAKEGEKSSGIKSPISTKPRKVRALKPKIDHESKESEADAKHPKPVSGERELVGESGIPEDEIIQAVLVLDNSRSMLKTDPGRIRDQGAKLFLQFLEPSDYFAIVQFAEDSKVVVPFTQVSKATGDDISDSLKSIVNDGNFTDFLSGVEIAQSLFEESSQIKAKNKAIIVISDGQNDPNPTKHTKEQVSEDILDKRIPTMRKKGIRVYTLAMSELSDQQFLAKISKAAGGLSWYADSMNEVHRVFSDLFLALKKPQVLELTKDGFEIDSSSNEATFIINRNHESDSITVIDPADREYVNSDFPSMWKWFRGELFDIITVPNPLPGRWLVKSSDKAQSVQPVTGYAKLITKLNLEYSWPQGALDVGTTAILKARLVGDPAILSDTQIKSLIFYSYKVVNVKTGAVYAQGKLLDSGSQGDEKAQDDIFSASINFNEDGEYKLFVSCTGPTFSRQAHVPVVISRGMISLERIPENTFSQKPEYLSLKLHGDAKNLKNRKISVVGEVLGVAGAKPYGIKISDAEKSETEFDIDILRFKTGQNKVYAVVSGVNSHGEEVRAKSEEVIVSVKPHDEPHGTKDVHSSKDEHDDVSVEDLEHHEGVAHAEGEEIPNVEDLHGEDSHDDGADVSKSNEPTTWYFGIIGPCVCLVVGFLCARLFIKRSKQEKGVSIVLRPAYEVEASLQQRLEKILETSSKTRKRVLKPEEIQVFAVLPELQQALSEASMNVAQSQESSGESLDEVSSESSLSESQTENGSESSGEEAASDAQDSETSNEVSDPDKTAEMEKPTESEAESGDDEVKEDE